MGDQTVFFEMKKERFRTCKAAKAMAAAVL
jgi:hypothetical protein